MNRLTLITLTLATLAIVPGCKNDKNNKTPLPTTGSLKPEVETHREVGTVSPVQEDDLAILDTQVPDFSGNPHDGPEGEPCETDHLEIGQGLIENGMYSEAMIELERGVFDLPEEFEIRKELGELYRTRGFLEMSIGHLRAAVEQVDDAPTHMSLAQSYFDLKDFDAATKEITATVKLDPTSPDPYRLLARVYQSRSMWKESIDACEEAIARGSDSPWTYNNLGFAHLILGSYDDSVRELEKAVSFDEGVTPQIWNNLGLAYEKKGQVVDAAGAYRAALAGNPTYVKAKVNLDRIVAVAKAQGIAIGAMKAEMDTKDLDVKAESQQETAVPVPEE